MSADVQTIADDSLARRNALLLSAMQGLVMINGSVIFTLGGIVGLTLAPEPALATVPITAMLAGSAVSAAPFSLFMQRFGRRPGFILGAACGLLGTLICAQAVLLGNFWLLCLGTHFAGYFQASGQYYRFAAADTASPIFRPRAISWVLLGGVGAALFGPQIIASTKDLLSPSLYAASFLALSVNAVLSSLVATTLRIPPPSASDDGHGAARPLAEILRQPRLIAAIAAGMVSYAMMSMVMTATPVAMIGCHHSPADAADTVRWHVVAMFLPSLVTGRLIARFGSERVIVAGMTMLAICGVVALSGQSVREFTIALILLGVGWNFGFIGATSLVTECHRASERGKVQAVNDLAVFGFVVTASALSGTLLAHFGWSGVNITLFPVIAVGIALVIVLPRLARPVSAPA